MAEQTNKTIKHTKGPWMAGVPSSIVGWPVVSAPADGRIICNMLYTSPTDEEVGANAALIAAAPEMLEALRTVRDTYLDDTPDVVVAAIAKAEGR